MNGKKPTQVTKSKVAQNLFPVPCSLFPVPLPQRQFLTPTYLHKICHFDDEILRNIVFCVKTPG
ncbi:MAG: hypothetical protein ACK57T_14595 [Dolichospermum sp.]